MSKISDRIAEEMTADQERAAAEEQAASLPQRIRDWDDWVEDEDEGQEEVRRPFDAGIMLGTATLLAAWDEHTPLAGQVHPDIVDAIEGMRDTVEAVLDGSGAFPEEEVQE